MARCFGGRSAAIWVNTGENFGIETEGSPQRSLVVYFVWCGHRGVLDVYRKMPLAKVRPLLLLCLLMRLGVEGFAYSAARAFAPQRWAGATEALPRVLLPRGGGRAGSVVSAASDDTTPLEEQLSRTKAMLDAEDYAGAADESAAALEVLPDLAEAARLRGRALLDPLLDQMLAGAQLEPSQFGEAYEAFRLAAVMDPENNEEARMELVRIEELCKMAADARKG